MRVECDMFDRWASLYRDHRLPGRARTAVERHLGYCLSCGRKYEAYAVALHEAKIAPSPSGLIPADVTHELRPRPTPGAPRNWRRIGAMIGLWFFGTAVLAAMLAAAFVLGFRAGARQEPTVTIEVEAPAAKPFSTASHD
jgi:predicted anti-sigma-YlaC factor YlaD